MKSNEPYEESFEKVINDKKKKLKKQIEFDSA
jgi:hypothetical protein